MLEQYTGRNRLDVATMNKRPMPRLMKNIEGDTTLKVTEHIILRNFWEYYVLETPNNSFDVKFCYVLGVESEFGDVYMPEIEDYVMLRTSNLSEVMAAPGYSWVS